MQAPPKLRHTPVSSSPISGKPIEIILSVIGTANCSTHFFSCGIRVKSSSIPWFSRIYGNTPYGKPAGKWSWWWIASHFDKLSVYELLIYNSLQISPDFIIDSYLYTCECQVLAGLSIAISIFALSSSCTHDPIQQKVHLVYFWQNWDFCIF